MSTYQINNIRLIDNFIDDTDPSKQLKLSLANLSPGTTLTLSIPNTTNTTIVGTTTSQTLTNKTINASVNTITNIGDTQIIAGIDAAKIGNGAVSNTEFQRLDGLTSSAVGISDAQTLTNKNITGTTNTVSASNLRTATTDVVISGATAPTTGQVLTATNATTANWQAPPFTLFLNNAGTVSNPTTLKQWNGRSTTSAGIATFQITNDGTASGTAIFTGLSLTTHYIQSTAALDNTSSTAVPFASIRSVSNSGRTVQVNIKTGNSGPIVIGGTYVGLQNAADGIDVYLNIIGA